MHVLTKIFIVLVSLLAVLLVPLVVVYAHNENSYAARYEAATAETAAAQAALASAKTSFGIADAQKEWQLEQLRAENRQLRDQVAVQETTIQTVQRDLVEAESGKEEINAKLATLVSAVDASQRLTESLIAELRQVRKEALDSERRLVQVDEALRDSQAKLEVAVQARRALQEELQRLKDEHGVTLDQLAQMIAIHGPLRAGIEGTGIPPTRDLDATVVHVRRDADQVLAEIDAGSRDGVEVGWSMPIGYGGDFVGRLRIISVDINRATGIVELEQRPVEVGHTVFARRR